MKDKLIEKINNLFPIVEDLQNKVSEVFLKPEFKANETVPKDMKMDIGIQMMNLNETTAKLVGLIEFLLDISPEAFEELSKDVQDYYNDIMALKSPPSDSDSEEVKKVREFLKGMK